MSSGSSSHELRLLLGGAHEVLDVVEVDLAQVGAPGRHRLAAEELETLEAGLQHPLGLVLEGRDAADDGFGEAALRDRHPAASASCQPNSYCPRLASSGRSMSTSDIVTFSSGS